ncbi:hypothetical protein B0J12DRAFT_705386 [Macrophomina phaseolina]|uniref:BAH domain-containing protein n=1 Tax=Macrophomina phaseolina TaxID=35725 RepID=A0ABQ8FV44_9PEZI|nr:hypothetical protein B0J12DRAFT_705386 [Macrophomina phaseolina]
MRDKHKSNEDRRASNIIARTKRHGFSNTAPLDPNASHTTNVTEAFGASDEEYTSDCTEPFAVYDNCSRFFSVQSLGHDVDDWDSVPTLPSLRLHEEVYNKGDVVRARTIENTTVTTSSMGQIAEIRVLPDGRSFVRVFWYVRRPKSDEISKRAWLLGYRYMKSTHTQVIASDCIVRRVPLRVQSMFIQPASVLDLSVNPAQVYREGSKQVEWTRV